MRLTIRELDRLQSVDIGAVDPAMLPDAGSVALNAALPQRDRVSCLVQAGINPYCFCVGGVGVKIEFSEDGPSLQDTLAAFLWSGQDFLDNYLRIFRLLRALSRKEHCSQWRNASSACCS